MGLLNWMMHRRMSRLAKEIVGWVIDSYQVLRKQYPDETERDLLGKVIEQRFKFPGGINARETALDKFGSSIYGICYYVGLNCQDMKGMMVMRCVQFTEYVDIELERHGFQKPSVEDKQRYFKFLGLPEKAVNESYLFPS